MVDIFKKLCYHINNLIFCHENDDRGRDI